MVEKLNSGVLPQLAFDFDKTYYLSGPMSDIEDHNWPAFEAAAEQLRGLAIKIISPAEIVAGDGNPKGSMPWDYYVKADLVPLVRDCDGIIMLRGWPKSRGARLEMSIALDLLYPVYYYDNYCLVDMNRWV
jgi:hypothetical protein